MKLHELKSTDGSRHKKKRVGRGDKTAGRGENGQKSRAGFSNKIGFEGGQNPLYRRLPKRGFTNINTKKYKIINLSDLSKLKMTEINPEILVEKKIIKKSDKLIKVLANGTIDSRVVVKAHSFSAKAKNSIEKAGGETHILKN